MRFKRIIPVVFTIIWGLCIISCNNSNNIYAIQSFESGKKYCFKNEFSFEDEPNVKDVEELELTIVDDKVTGVYNWLPAYKDQRTGSIIGTIDKGQIICQYTFLQEGVKNNASIKIILENNKAIISSENKELGLDATITEIKCLND